MFLSVKGSDVMRYRKGDVTARDLVDGQHVGCFWTVVLGLIVVGGILSFLGAHKWLAMVFGMLIAVVCLTVKLGHMVDRRREQKLERDSKRVRIHRP